MILVTGGTGLLGAHLLYKLAEAGYAIKAIYRDQSKIKRTEKVFSYYSSAHQALLDQIEWVQADITDIPALQSAFDGITKVYHCAALVSFDPKDDHQLLTTNVKGTENIVNLCVEHKITKLCFASSIAAIGPGVQGQPITEDNDWSEAPTTTYAISKHLAEMKVWRASQEGVPVAIVNPGVIVGPGFWRSGSGSFFSFAAKEPKYYLPGGTGFVNVDDVVTAMLLLMESTTKNERYILVSDNLSFGEFMGRLANGLNKAAPSRELKHWMLSVFWRWDWLRAHLLGKRRRLSKVVAQGFASRERYDNTKLQKQHSFKYTSLDEAILKCSAIFLKEAGKR